MIDRIANFVIASTDLLLLIGAVGVLGLATYRCAKLIARGQGVWAAIKKFLWTLFKDLP